MAGRKSKLTPEVFKAIHDTLAGGSTIRDACAFAGISQDSFANYCRQNSEFSDTVKKAQAQARIISIARIRKAGNNGEWQADAWFLERSDPAAWGRKDMLIALGLDAQLLKQLKARADSAGVDLAQVFEAMINELGTVNAAANREE